MARTGNIAARDLRVSGPRRRLSPVAVGLTAGLAALVLYGVTSARGVEWQDSGIHQYRILTGQVSHPLGLALAHPLYYWLGRAALHIPLGGPLARLNLLSSVCGAIGVGVLSALLTRLTRSYVSAGLAAATLALAHAYWQMSALTESYTLAAAALSIEWTLLLCYARTRQPAWLMAVFAVNGLHVADHLLGLLALATYGVLLLDRVIRRRMAAPWLAVAALVWLVTAAPYWTLVLASYQQTGDLVGTLRSAFFGGSARTTGWSDSVLNLGLSAAQARMVVLTFGYCFPSAAGLVALVGLWWPANSRRRLFRRVLLAQTVIIGVFVARYTIKDLYTYFVPVCMLTAFWFGCGVAWLLRRVRRRRWVTGLLVLNALLPLLVYAYFPLIAQQRGWLKGQLRDAPYRDEYRAFFRPWRVDDDSAARFAHQALAELGDRGWLIGDNTTAFPVAITYLVQGGPPTVRVYWFRECLTDPTRPPLTDEELAAHVRDGGRVLLVPSALVERQIPPPLEIDKTQPLWRVRAPTP